MDPTLELDPQPTGDVVRTPLVERVLAARPAIVSLVAPAGFGKSSLARQLLAGYAARGVCDCGGVRSAVELARRLLPALADESPERAASLAQSETVLGDGHGSADERVEVALAAWRAHGPPSAFVLENAEDALAEPGARLLLTKLLANRPAGRTIVICSREPLRVHLSRYAPPHRILSLRAADLAFGPAEIAAVLAPAGAGASTVERVAAVSGGWPIAVLLLARFAHEGRLEALLERLDDVAYEELHEYLADQVLGDAPPAVTDGLLVCAALPQAGEGDLRLALGDAGYAAFEQFRRGSPFVTRDGAGGLTVHPLLASSLVERHPDRIEALLAPTAAAYERAGAYLRAAEIQLARGDQSAAAAALDRLEPDPDAAPPIAYARVLASLDRAVVVRFPRLWAVTAVLRSFTVDARLLLAEAEALWQRLPAGAPPAERISLFVWRVLFMSYAGDFERGLALVDGLRAQLAAPAVPTSPMHAWLLYLRSLMTARLGRLHEAERDLRAAWPFVDGMPVMASGTLVALGAHVARVRGERAAEREQLERALDHSRASGLSNLIARDEAEAAFGAWLAGDEADYVQHAFALEAEVEREGVGGFVFFVACTRGHGGAQQPQPADGLEWVACGRLLAAAGGDDLAEQRRQAELAREAAALYRAPFGQVLAALALAEFDPARRRALHAEAASIAQRIDAPELQAAIASLARGDDGAFLAPFVRRYRRAGAAPAAGLLVELVTGRMLRDGAPVMLPEREQALLVALAMRPEALSRERLTDMLWPDLSESAARNAFHVCLHRLKSRLGDDDAVVRTREGYRLGSGMRVDLWEIDRTLAALRTAGAPQERRAGALQALYDALRGVRPDKFADWEWFEPTERRLRELRCELAQGLANAALEDGRTQDALALAHEMIDYDPCDEPAREIAIRAYLAGGDRAAALRHFRQYRDILAAELQCEPSEALAALVGATG